MTLPEQPPQAHTRQSYCRLCAGMCGTLVSVDAGGRIVGIRGDKSHPMTSGYACIKGLQAEHIHHGESRLLHPLKRMPDGSFARIGLEQALDEIAARLRTLIDDSGPRSVALYRGTQNYFNSAASALAPAWLAAIGSPCYFSSATIDQSSKFVTAERMGVWEAGVQPIESCDVWMAVGFNPLVSVQAFMGFPALNPTKRLHALKAGGMKLIVIDPRRTETAHHADLHLQPYPGQDAALAAGLLNVILSRGWHDAVFCAAHANGVDALREAVAPFTPER
ncbi:MAG TPA: molybdopterin-dependent oxidoreductase, partial [Ramlibacter sp.]|nr:molybdopterin-dependent oxidoreductase [Ramlibacter sp.]